MNVELGQRVRDTISGVEGTVISRTQWLHGCVRLMVQPAGAKDGVPYSTFSVDEPQVEVIDEQAAPKAEPAHGPRNDPGRRPDPTR